MLEISTSANCNKCGKWVNYNKGKQMNVDGK